MPPQLDLVKNTTAQILSHPTWDIVVVFALLAIGFFYGISSGKRRIAATIIYTYVALALFSVLPLEKIGAGLDLQEKFFVKAGGFLIIFLLLALLLGSRRGRGMAPASSWWQIFLLSFLQIGLLIHIILTFLSPERIKLLAPLTKNVFANSELHLWWLILPIVILVILRRLEARTE